METAKDTVVLAAEPQSDRPLNFAPGVAAVPSVDVFDVADNPPWGLPAGLLVWVASVMFLLFIPVFFLAPYIITKGEPVETLKNITTDTTAIFLSVISIFPVHILSFGVAWAVVTKFGKRPFWRPLGWGWSRRFNFWTSATLAIVLFFTGLVITKLFGGQETDIDFLIKSSTATRIALAVLAATTGPFVEEIIYRGVLYSALQKQIGALWSVVCVSALFTLVHVGQYKNNFGVIAAVGVLSIALTTVRAVSGRLLPCFIIHMVFNGITSVIILFQPYLERFETGGEQPAAIILMLWRAIHPIT